MVKVKNWNISHKRTLQTFNSLLLKRISAEYFLSVYLLIKNLEMH